MGKMTLADWRDEFQQWLAAIPVKGTPESQAAVRAWIDGVIQAAQEEERAACAEVAEQEGPCCLCDKCHERAAAAIRARAD